MRTILANTDYGLFSGLANDEIMKMLVRDRTYEPHLIELFNRVVDPHDVAIDVGANIGFHTVNLAKRVGDHGKVFSIEPQRLMHQFLTTNCLLNNQFNVTSFQSAASNNSGMLALANIDYSVQDLNSGCGRISLGGEEVSQFRLDSLPLDLPPKFIKIDAQGAEPFVIDGASGLLKTFPRPVLCFEVEDIWLRQLGSNTETLLNLVLSYQYEVLRIVNDYPCDHIAIPKESFQNFFDRLSGYPFQLQHIPGPTVDIRLRDNNLYELR